MRRECLWITGCEGRLGSELMRLFKKKYNYKLVTTDRDVDITNLQEVNRAADIYEVDIVINCASISDREYCEKCPAAEWCNDYQDWKDGEQNG